MQLEISPRRRLSGLGQWIEGAAALLKLANQPGGGGAASPSGNAGGGYSGGGTSVTTSTQVSTQVSPQISPVMVQQQQPQNSAVNANPSMWGGAMTPTQSLAVPQGLNTPVAGATPGFDYASGYAPSGVPSTYAPNRTAMGIGVAAALALGLAFILKKKRK